MPSHIQSFRAVVSLAACLAILLSHSPGSAAERAPDETASPMGGGGSAVLERVPEKTPATATPRVVFTCVTPGLTTFSDRPCGPLPERRQIDLLHATENGSGAASSVRPPPARASTRPAVAAGDRQPPMAPRSAGRPPGCDELRHDVAVIDQQMRAGYSARAAPRLWERWREAKERLRAAGCT